MTPELIEGVTHIARHCRRDVHWRKGPDGPRLIRAPVKKKFIEEHCSGGRPVGLSQIPAGDNRTQILVLDLDSHKGEINWTRMTNVSSAISAELDARNLRTVQFRSSGGKGIHLIALWREPQDAYSVRQLAIEALAAVGLSAGARGLKDSEVEIFPKQDTVPADGFGNMTILPMCGESIMLHGDGSLASYEEFELLKFPYSQPVPVRIRPTRAPPDIPTFSSDLEVLRGALNSIDNSGEGLGYDDWFRVIAAVHFASHGSDEGLALAQEFSARSSKYDPDFFETRVWAHLRSDRERPVTANTIRALAAREGWIDPAIADAFEEIPIVVKSDQDSQPRSSPAKPEKVTWPVIALEDFAAQPPVDWLIDKVLPKHGYTLLFGDSGTGKTFIALDMMGAVARGVPWFGKETRQGRGLYIAAEGGGGFRNRALAYSQHYDLPGGWARVLVLKGAPNFLQKEDTKKLVEIVRPHGRFDFIVVDTLARTTIGASENDAQDMSLFVSMVDKFAAVMGAVVMVIHHSGKDADRGARGSAVLKQAADAEYEVTRQGDVRTLKVSKMKDGIDGERFHFALEPIQVEPDQFSCVVRPADAPTFTRQPQGARQQDAWRIAHDVFVGGEALVSDLLEAVTRTMVSDEREPWRARAHAKRAIQALADQGFLQLDGDQFTVKSQDDENE